MKKIYIRVEQKTQKKKKKESSLHAARRLPAQYSIADYYYIYRRVLGS